MFQWTVFQSLSLLCMLTTAKCNAQETYLFATKLSFCHKFTSNFFTDGKFHIEQEVINN